MQYWISRIAITVAALGVGCGEVDKSGGLPDAGQTVDAPPTAPPVVKATVYTTAGDGSPDLTAKVLFQDPDGGVIAEATVDANGHAEAQMPRGGSVTAFRVSSDTPNGFQGIASTITGVKAGDDLAFGRKAGGASTQGKSTFMSVSFPEGAPGAAHTLWTSCGSVAADAGATTATLTFYDGCHGATFDLLVVESGGRALGPSFIKLTGVAYKSDGSIVVPGPYTAMASPTINLANTPDGLTQLEVSRWSMLEHTAVNVQTTASTPTAGTMSVAVPYAQDVGTRSQVAALLARKDATGQQKLEVRTSTLTAGIDADLSKLKLPWVTSALTRKTGTTWKTIDATGTPDGVLGAWLGTWNDGTRPFSILRYVALPSATDEIKLPSFPPSFAMFDPGQQTSTVTPTISAVIMLDYDVVDGYDGFRQMPETLVTTLASSFGAFVGQPFQRRMYTFGGTNGIAASRDASPEYVRMVQSLLE